MILSAPSAEGKEQQESYRVCFAILANKSPLIAQERKQHQGSPVFSGTQRTEDTVLHTVNHILIPRIETGMIGEH